MFQRHRALPVFWLLAGQDASDGEAYDFEMSAGAIDKDGNEYTVYWLFEGRKGEDDYALDSYDYRAADRVVEQ